MAATTAAVIGAASAVGGVALSAKAQSDARKAANSSGIDIAALDAQTRAIAQRNAQESAALEMQMSPEVVALRRQSNLAALNGLTTNPNQQLAIAQMMARFGNNLSTPLLDSAVGKAQSDLALGGRLGLDQRNEATRRAGATTGSVTGGLGLARDISARDLGLTSYAVEQQRLQNAANLGGLELNREQSNQGNFLNQFNALNSYYNNQRGLDLATAQYGQSIAPPIIGLDPSSYANLMVGNQNNQTQARIGAANAQGATGQALMGMGGSFLGYGAANGAFQSTPQSIPWSQGFGGGSSTAGSYFGPGVFGGINS